MSTSTLQIFNTLSAKKEPFVPLEGKSVRMYACGPTVYDSSHLGHARMAIVWDVIQRYLRFLGYEVTFVRNITDVDDKIIKRANELGLKPEQVAREYTYEFWKDMHDLNVSAPDYEPKATEYIQWMIEFAEKLIAKGSAYESKGDVYFDVRSFSGYGKLSKQDIEQLIVGSREQARSQEELQDVKRSSADFALWKKSKDGEIGWDSPWGYGRPGWHLECSTMIRRVLGETIDIHGGGEDLVFPHHENEIAQSEALHDKPLAKYWLHNSFVQVSAEKMSKSLGNYSTIQDLLKTFSADAIRLLILQTHYRNPIDFTIDSLTAAKTAVQRLVRAAAHSDFIAGERPDAEAAKAIAKLEEEFKEAMNNDFNTAVAISLLFTLSDKVFATKDAVQQAAYANSLKKLGIVLGLLLEDNRQVLDFESTQKVMDLVLELRKEARARKDYATSDLIRNRLTESGINVMDTAGGQVWEKA